MDQTNILQKAVKKSLSSALVALVVVMGSFYLEYSSVAFEASTLTLPSTASPGTNLVDAHRVIRKDGAAQFSVQGELNNAQITLTQGRIWLNTLNSAYTTQVKAGSYTIMVPPGVVSITTKDGVTALETFSRIALVTVAHHQIIVPQGKGVVLYDSKIKNLEKELTQIRLSKLYKEFALYTVTNRDAWSASNLAQDAQLKQEEQKNLVARIRARGASVSSDQTSVFASLSSMSNSLAATLALNANKKNEYLFEDAQRYFDAALYSELLGKDKDAQALLSTFESKVKPIAAVSQDALLELLQIVASNTLQDQYAPEKTSVMSLISHTAMQQLEHAVSDVYDVLNQPVSPVQREYLRAAMNKLAYVTEKNVSQLNEDESIAMSNLIHTVLISSTELYRDSYFRSLALLQDAAVNRSATKDAKIDTQQFFILQKLDALQSIKKSLDAQRVDFATGRAAMIFIAQTIDLMKPLLSDTAFLPYFEAQYADIASFIAFLKTQDAAQVRGSFDQDFAAYKNDVTEANYIHALLNTATGGETLSTVDREQRIKIAATDLATTALTDVKIGFDSIPDSSIVIITSAQFDGAQFSARYDTVRKIFTDVVFDGKEVPNGIRLENVRTFLLVSRGKMALQGTEKIESLTEKPVDDATLKVQATVDALKKELADSGITVDQRYIDSSKYDSGTIRVLLATRGDEPAKKLFSFEVTTDLTTAKNLEVQTVAGQLPINDEFPLKELAFRVDQIFERAIFEKSKDEEVNQLLKQNADTAAPETTPLPPQDSVRTRQR